jgi:hypothetical protein
VTTAVREAPHHRNLTCYTDYRCRRPECVERRRQWQRDLRRRKREGQPALVDAQPVREHILRLHSAGISTYRISLAAGVDDWTVRSFLPSTTGHRAKKHRTTPEIARKILNVTIETATSGHVDGTGTRRRIQALAAMGWPIRRVAEYLGLNPTYAGDLIRRTEQDRPVLAATAEKVARAYDTLKTKKPTRNGIEPRVAKRIRGLAKEKRWPTPGYWDQHPGAIDDPHFEPMYGLTRREIVAQDAHWVMTTIGLDRASAAERLGVAKSYIDHAFRDHPEYAVEVAA